ncbi:MAG: hypothetical protein JWO30_4596 [Fibrobacteres bacterium]|nr:hypothetical protein [Fibrobacterota bacterium]
MGRRLAAALAERGHRVRVLCLPGDPAAASLQGGDIEIVRADITKRETLPAALDGVETVFHLAAVLLSPGNPQAFQAVNADGTRNLAEAAKTAGAKHFIYVSSISVEYPRSNAYARSKLRGEEWVKASGLAYTIVRPSLAYEDGGAIEFLGFVDHLRRAPVILLPQGGRALKSPVHIEDLVAGFLALPRNPLALGKTYVFSGGDALSLREMARSLLAYMGRPKPIVGVPAWICLLGVAALWARDKATGGKTAFTWQTYTGLVQDAAPSHQAAERDLGFRPRPFREGLATLVSLRDCLKNPP